MAIHRRALEQHVSSGASDVYAVYIQCLADTFGPEYVAHLERWLAADGVAVPATI